MGKGQDCTAISGASSVGCEAGVCKGTSLRPSRSYERD